MEYNKIGFIGSGKMAGAIIKGLIKTKFTASDNLLATQATSELIEERSKELGIKIPFFIFIRFCKVYLTKCTIFKDFRNNCDCLTSKKRAKLI